MSWETARGCCAIGDNAFSSGGVVEPSSAQRTMHASNSGAGGTCRACVVRSVRSASHHAGPNDVNHPPYGHRLLVDAHATAVVSAARRGRLRRPCCEGANLACAARPAQSQQKQCMAASQSAGGPAAGTDVFHESALREEACSAANHVGQKRWDGGRYQCAGSWDGGGTLAEASDAVSLLHDRQPGRQRPCKRGRRGSAVARTARG